MPGLTLHDKTTAPEDSGPLLAASEQAVGMVPNLHAVMAEPPQVLQAYQDLHGLFQQTSLGTVWNRTWSGSRSTSSTAAITACPRIPSSPRAPASPPT